MFIVRFRCSVRSMMNFRLQSSAIRVLRLSEHKFQVQVSLEVATARGLGLLAEAGRLSRAPTLCGGLVTGSGPGPEPRKVLCQCGNLP